jgi:hypothetical protein
MLRFPRLIETSFPATRPSASVPLTRGAGQRGFWVWALGSCLRRPMPASVPCGLTFCLAQQKPKAKGQKPPYGRATASSSFTITSSVFTPSASAS